MKGSHRLLLRTGVLILLVLAVTWPAIRPLQVRYISNAQLGEALSTIEAGNPNTAYWYSIVGDSGKTIYLEYETMLHPLGFLTKGSRKIIMLIDWKDLDEVNMRRVQALQAKSMNQNTK